VELPKLTPDRLTGTEPFLGTGDEPPLTVCDFWQWSVSDLVSNLTRGRLAEFIVAHALQIDVRKGVRNEWDRFDLQTASGVKVEVKSAAYLQSWYQRQVSNVGWQLGPTRGWDAATNVFSPDAEWHADVYLLALFAQQEKVKVNPLDVARWQFFAVPVDKLRHRRKARFMSLQAVLELEVAEVGFDGIAQAVEKAHRSGTTT
jgi:hypothetical protein